GDLMSTLGISRRDVLKTLAAGAAGGSVLQVIPLQATELAHQMVRKGKATAAAGEEVPRKITAMYNRTIKSVFANLLFRDTKNRAAQWMLALRNLLTCSPAKMPSFKIVSAAA